MSFTDWVSEFLEATPATPLVRMIAIGSLNGVGAVNGRSGALGNSTDQALLAAVRTWADAVVATAHTAHTEQYQIPQPIENSTTLPPVIVLLSNSLHLSLSDAIFSPAPRLDTAHPRVMVATTAQAAAAHPGTIDTLERRGIDVLRVAATNSGHGVDIPALIIELRARGLTTIAIEGGPHLYHEALQTHSIDEIIYSIAPRVVFPDELRTFGTASVGADSADHHLKLLRTHIADSMIYARYKVDRSTE
ncbi:MAG: dihydrofolate reductase family protein [Corynebacterium sp.]|nr:dihydrofolate reductase family protein [Corynebacterium sp.]